MSNSRMLIGKLCINMKGLLFKARMSLWDLRRRCGGDLISFRRGMSKWTVFAWDQYVGRQLYVYGSWQFREIDFTIDWLRQKKHIFNSSKVIVNVGAFIGSTAVRLAQRTSSRVLAIEPVPDFFKLLKINVENNCREFGGICHQSAVFDNIGEQVMAIPNINPGASELALNGQSSPVQNNFTILKKVNVRTAPLVNIIEANQIELTSISLVWADAQGCEGHIIRTGADLWKRGIPLVIEFWPRGFLFQEKADILPLIREHFRSFCVLPNYRCELRLQELPIEQLEHSVIGSEEEADLILLP